MMQNFGELLTEYMRRTGISDSELARSIGVQRQTIFRWKEGSVARPRVREDVLRCASRLRLTREECDMLLLAAGFPPENPIGMQPQPTPQSELSTNADDPVVGSLSNGDQTLDSPEIGIKPQTFVAESASVPSIPLDRLKTTRRRWLGAGIFVLIAALASQFARWERPVPDQPTATSVQPAVNLIPTQISSPTVNASPTPSATPTPKPTATLEQARANEQLIVIAEFDNRAPNQGYNMAGRLQEAIASEIINNGLSNVRTITHPDVLKRVENAQTLLKQTKAALIIWGEYDSGRVVVRYADHDSQNQFAQELQEVGQLPVVINRETPKEVKALALAILGQTYSRAGESDKAKSVLQLALQQEPEAKDIRARSLFYLARIIESEAEKLGSIALSDQAIDYYTQLAELNPQPERDWVNIWYNRGTSYLYRSYMRAKNAPELQRDLTAAIADFEHSLTILPTYKAAFLNRGTAYYERRQPQDLTKAIADFEEAIQLSPTYFSAYFMRGLARLRSDASANWESDFRRAKELDPSNVDVYVALCWGYILTNQLQNATAVCDEMRRLSDDSPDHADLQAILLAQNGDLAKALDEVKRHLAWIKTEPAQFFERRNGQLVEAWIVRLEKGENPFDSATLEQLRKGE